MMKWCIIILIYYDIDTGDIIDTIVRWYIDDELTGIDVTWYDDYCWW